MKKTTKSLIIILIIIILILGGYFLVHRLKNLKNYFSDLAYQNYLQQNYNEANDQYDKAKKYWFLSASDNYYYAVTYYQLGEYSKATDRYKIAYTKDFNRYDCLNNIGNDYRNYDNLDKAKEYYEKAIAFDKTRPEAYLNLIFTFYNDQDFLNNLLIQVQDNMADNNSKVAVLFAFVNIYQDTGNINKVKEIIDNILVIDPNNSNAKAYYNYYNK